MHRRHLLAALTAGLAGCPGDAGTGESAAGTPASTAIAARRETPTLPYASANPDENVSSPRSVEVRNWTSRDQYVTVVVEDGPRTVFVGSQAVPAERTRSFDDLVTRRGVYRVTVETATGARTVHDWVVTDEWSQRDLTVFVSPTGVETRQYAFCTPTCPPIESSGTAGALPREDPTDPGREAEGVVVVDSDRSEAVPVRLVVRRDETLIDYTYRLPAGISLIVPVADRQGRYDLRVESPEGALSTPWYLPEEPYPRVATTPDGVVADCTTSETRLVAVRNRSGERRRVSVRVVAGGRTHLDRAFDLAPGTAVTDPVTVPGETPLDVRVTTEERSLSATWTLCPPSTLSVFVLSSALYVETSEGNLISHRGTARR